MGGPCTLGPPRCSALLWTFLSLPLCCRKYVLPPFPTLLPAQLLTDVGPMRFSLVWQARGAVSSQLSGCLGKAGLLVGTGADI